ncbi:MAG: anthranilate synthase component I [Gammaproteobacteria bacterium]|nr:MAG: anthranilate synthase component I [Gammaproteobacteria bacterium]
MSQNTFKLLSRSLEAEVEPMLIFEACRKYSHKDYRILLESSEQGTSGTQRSMLLLNQSLKIEARGFQVSISPLNDNGRAAMDILSLELPKCIEDSVTFELSDAEILLSYPDNRLIEEESIRIKRTTALDAIRQVLSILTKGNRLDAEKLLVAGVVGYDFIDSLELLPPVDFAEEDFPDFIFLLADSQIIIDQTSNRIEIREIIFSGEGEDFRIGQARGRLNSLEEVLLENSSASISDLKNYRPAGLVGEAVKVYPEACDFKNDVLKVKEAIAKGQIFQTVISRNFTLNCSDTILAYQFLKQQNPSPYQFYLQLGEYTLFGASPESSLRYQQEQRSISIMPIAGTRKRGRYASGEVNAELDARLEADLILDEKELAEHLMLVDLARNDLARIAETGSRKVQELMSVYRYSAVMHMVSRISATLRSGLDIYHACQSCFHMGTLTGAPKKQAMILIRELEQRRRGAYGGAVGYFNGAGDMDTAIVIRSALVKNNQATITAGAGIVADSTPENELTETELKAAAVIKAIQYAEDFNLTQTQIQTQTQTQIGDLS